ncbi:MAG: DUF4445 domain-containing protein [Thermoleophilia bacterium]|nr:DUF4445 domain-containing protein [Thermoleophilia bacterium]
MSTPSGQEASSYTVIFQPSGRRGQASPGQDLLSISRSLGVEIESACGGKGKCGKCRVRIEAAADDRSTGELVSPPTEAESQHLGAEGLATGLRLACQTQVRGDLRVFVPEESRRAVQVVRKEAGQRTVPLDPAIKCYHIVLTPPTLDDPQADAERVLAALAEQHDVTGLTFDIEALRKLPSTARNAKWELFVITWQGGPAGGSIVELRPAAEPGHVLGLAVDVGTTTVAAYLVDLRTGQVHSTESGMNPQVAFGDDVISRLYHAVRNEDGVRELQQTLITEVNGLARKGLERCGATPHDIFDVVMVGNTAMHHLFLGLDPQSLGTAPFTPAIKGAVDARASALGLEFHPNCRLHVLPVEAGFVGADNVAVIIAEEPYNQDEVLLIVDIGTNGELVLGNRDRMVSASCATGPALEGAHIESGMRAAPGAIERIRIDPETLDVRFKVIGLEGWSTDHPAEEVQARGICGSGILEAAAEMAAAGVILPSGAFNPELSHERVVLEDGRPRKFVIAKPEETAIGRAITVSLKDIRSIQLAKGALRAGAEILLRTYGAELPDRVVLAGAFGSYIDKYHALAIGMLPPCEPDRVTSVGNSAGDGARFALLSVGKRREAVWAADHVEYVELATDRDFQAEYVKAMAFGENA